MLGNSKRIRTQEPTKGWKSCLWDHGPIVSTRGERTSRSADSIKATAMVTVYIVRCPTCVTDE